MGLIKFILTGMNIIVLAYVVFATVRLGEYEDMTQAMFDLMQDCEIIENQKCVMAFIPVDRGYRK